MHMLRITLIAGLMAGGAYAQAPAPAVPPEVAASGNVSTPVPPAEVTGPVLTVDRPPLPGFGEIPAAQAADTLDSAQASDEALAAADPAAATPDSTQAEPATAPVNAADGTAPGAAGSTGWTGGTGGAFIGTNPSGAVAVSKSWQPPTARGLDLGGAPDAVPAASGG
ncbi:hypothetical protein [Paracoccus sp. S-4012]|uniref:hypothetical protein n=1 Tax=Paracoccus sp. S-4012 TaxID=2665648 RepID=UPI001E3D47F4|nr:hypothetical protein [Paracoccus sp. S-4012]